MIPLQDVQTVVTAMPALWQVLLSVCSGIAAIAAAVAIITKPRKAMLARIDALEKKHKEDQQANEQRLAADLSLLNEMNGTIKHLNYGVFVLLDHAATGNSIERCKEARDKLERHSSGM